MSIGFSLFILLPLSFLVALVLTIILIVYWRELGFLASIIVMILLYALIYTVRCHQITCGASQRGGEFEELLAAYLSLAVMYCSSLLGMRYVFIVTKMLLKWLFDSWRW